METTTIIPIRNPNNPANGVNSYRAISLTDTMGKILEKLVLKKVNKHITQNNVIIPEQFGFRCKHNAELQLDRRVDRTKINF